MVISAFIAILNYAIIRIVSHEFVFYMMKLSMT